ncbi:MAG TPA: hypothetical protein ENH94_08410, partial [Phycisphaerales bacterium]|nr:hypothetical protein [Phycisphaerales bacterium]
MESGHSSQNVRTVTVLLVLLAAALTASWALPDKAMEGHECFVSVTARQMLASGDWIVPEFNGQMRLQKTPLNYWMVASISKLTGKIDELTTRLPSMLLAIASVAAILYFVNQWSGFTAAVIAALVWATSLGFFRYSHSGRPEMSLACFTAIAMLSFYSGVTEQNRKRQIRFMLIFWIAFSLAMLAKGPAPLPLVVVPLLAWIIAFRKFKTIPKMLPVIGSIIFLVVSLAWPIAVLMQLSQGADADSAGHFWQQESIARFMGQNDSGDKPLYYYLPVMFQFMAPWVAFVPMALFAPFYKVWQDKRKVLWYLWIWFVGDIVIMSISGGKRMHYIFPAMPAMAVMIGILLEDMIFLRKAYDARFVRNLVYFHGGIFAAGAIAAVVYVAINNPVLLNQTIAIAAVAIISITLAAVLLIKNKKAAGFATIIAGYCVLMMTGYSFFAVPQSKLRYSKQFAQTVAAAVPTGAD